MSNEKNLGYNEYKVRKNGDLLEMTMWAGDSARALSEGLADRRWEKRSEGKDEDGYDTLSCVSLLAGLPSFEAGETVGTFDCGYGVWQILFMCESEADAAKYADTLKTVGFELLSVNRKAENVFWQFKNEEKVITVSYVPFQSSLRVIAEPVGGAVISGLKDENYETVCTSQVTQIGLGCDRPGKLNNFATDHPSDISMSYAVRLCDGSFIVYDGGMPWKEYADRLYTVLKSQTAVGKPIVIAAWVLTHSHPDHTGVFDMFADEYADKIQVENIVLNFHRIYSDGIPTYQDGILKQAKKFAGARIMKVHSGTDLYFRNAKMEVLFDQELIAPLPITNLNTATLVTRLELEGKTFMFLGDHADCSGGTRYPVHSFNNGAIRKMYGDYLKSDVVQVAHHGLGGGGTPKLYDLIAAKYALWPVGEDKFLYHKLGQNATNAYFLRDDVITLHAFDKLQILFLKDGEITYKEYDSYAAYEQEESTVPNYILPRVKSQIEQEGKWIPKKMISFFADKDDALGQKAIVAAEYFLPSHYIVTADQADVTLKKLAGAPKAEWYRLTANADGVTLEYADARGAINAMASFAQMVLDGVVHACVIEDYPDYSYRGLMLDLARGLREPFQDVKDVITHMALSKYSTVRFHLQDSESLCFASKILPKLRGSKKRNYRQYTKEQLRELVEHCAIFAMDAIPEIEVPAHAGGILEAYPDFACEVPPEHTSKWCICPGSDGVFEMYEKLIAEICEIFPGKYFHIGTDELEFRFAKSLNQFCYWRECPKCQKLREEKGLAGIQEQFYYVVMRIYEYVKANGKTMMMWNDEIDIAKECPLPKDILVQFWRIAGNGNGPVEGCSMEGFARQGYQIVNSTYPKTYIDFNSYLKEEELCKWTPVTSPEIYEEGHKYVIGSEMCAWEYGNREEYDFYDYTIQPNLPLFADRLWCSDPIVYDRKYRENVYKFMFGRKLDCDLYHIFGSIVPPRKKDPVTPLTYKSVEDVDSDYLAACIEEIAKPGEGGVYQNLRLTYVKLLQRISIQKFEANEAAAKAAKIAAANVAIANA